MKISEASLSAVCAVVILYSLPMFVYALIEGVELLGAFVILFSLTFTLGIIVFLFAFLCLIPLTPLFNNVSKVASFSIFLALGFSIPIIIELSYFSSILTRQLENSPSSHNNALLRLGLIGMLASMGSWYYLHFTSEPPKKALNKDVTTVALISKTLGAK